MVASVGLRASPPDASAWTEPRNYHEPFDESYRRLIKLSQSTSITAASPTALFSINRIYRLDLSPPRDDGQTTELLITNQTTQFTLIFKKTHPNFPAEARWINEKLVFIRVWWGRTGGSDFIFDAEAGRFIHEEMVHDGTILFQQTQQAKAATAVTAAIVKDGTRP